MSKKLKINRIQSFEIKAERAGYYAVCTVTNMQNGYTSYVYLAAPSEASYSNFFNPKTMDAELWNLADEAMYEFLSTEDFVKNKEFYFEWMTDNKFHKLELKPDWME